VVSLIANEGSEGVEVEKVATEAGRKHVAKGYIVLVEAIVLMR
jgi:hypothetical protein